MMTYMEQSMWGIAFTTSRGKMEKHVGYGQWKGKHCEPMSKSQEKYASETL